MNKKHFQTMRTEIISGMLDNPDKYGIYPTAECYAKLDKLYDEIKLPSELQRIRRMELMKAGARPSIDESGDVCWQTKIGKSFYSTSDRYLEEMPDAEFEQILKDHKNKKLNS